MPLVDNQHKTATWTNQFIAGSWVEGSGEKMIENINPYTGEVIATWRSSSQEDIDQAYESAQKSSVERLLELVKQTEDEGAQLVLGGTHQESVLMPTVLADVKPEQEIVQQELFGPVAIIMKAEDEQHAVQLANDTPYGLSGSVFTGNLERGYQVAQQIESGMVHVNDQSVNDEAHVMFGGEKSSGIGRFGGEWAIDKFTRTRWISLQHQFREYPGIK